MRGKFKLEVDSGDKNDYYVEHKNKDGVWEEVSLAHKVNIDEKFNGSCSVRTAVSGNAEYRIWRIGKEDAGSAGAGSAGGSADEPLILKATANPANGKPIKESYIHLLSAEIEEVSPKLQDENDKDIKDSEKPVLDDPDTQKIETTPMVEAYGGDDYKDRIAFRELKIKVAGAGEVLKDKKITWSMEAFGVKEGYAVRGDWKHSPSHKDRFEKAKNYGEYGFKRLSQEEGETIFKKEGKDAYSAIRINLPPIAFNKAKIKIKVETGEGICNQEIELLTLEVPAVVVIDPGHGTGKTKSGSNAYGATGRISKVVEHDFAFDMANRMVKELKEIRDDKKIHMRIFSTRENSSNISAIKRTEVARVNGCDVYVSIHFNPSSNHLHRNPFGMWDATGNLNLDEDKNLAISLRKAVQQAISTIEPQESNNAPRSKYTSEYWEANLQKGLDTCSDKAGSREYNGNVSGYTPCRAALIEMEWMSHEQADRLFNMTPFKDKMRAEAAKKLAEACIKDMEEYKEQ